MFFGRFMFDLIDRWADPISQRLFDRIVPGFGAAIFVIGVFLLGVLGTTCSGDACCIGAKRSLHASLCCGPSTQERARSRGRSPPTARRASVGLCWSRFLLPTCGGGVRDRGVRRANLGRGRGVWLRFSCRPLRTPPPASSSSTRRLGQGDGPHGGGGAPHGHLGRPRERNPVAPVPDSGAQDAVP